MITMEQIKKQLGEEIKYCGIAQVKIASAIGVKQPCVSAYLHGQSVPGLDTFANLCVLLQVNPAEILCIDDKIK